MASDGKLPGMDTGSSCALSHSWLTQVLDLTAPAWECLDEGAWATTAKPCRGGCAWSAFSGGRLLTLRPGLDDRLTELQACTCPPGQPRFMTNIQHALKRVAGVAMPVDAFNSMQFLKIDAGTIVEVLGSHSRVSARGLRPLSPNLRARPPR